ncbi:type II toxin-antitoxin system Phd/YefM family antitoxin [Lebetimonas sp. JH292]|uniref:type II toxin-antitoxin system Phd/YefM family antitoxin n=1 Tax=Lebetimonas sp. JH292 TaxID=990068 RepID=UPI0004637C07|nr:type II toxin-antitoxin system Phd/YefM family antitoxin [Lebetimonas sp. JH292]
MINVVDLRKRGIKAIEEEIKKENRAIITFKGKPAYVMLPIKEYEKIMLDKAYNELKAKKEKNEAFVSGADELIKRIENEL